MADDSGQRTMELYKICVDEEHYFLSEHQKRIAFYTGLLSAILTLTIGGFLKATTWYHFGMLAVGGLLLATVSVIAKAGTGRIYQRFLETVTTRAKLEHDLRLSEDRGREEGGWPEAEPYSPTRHLESRSNKKWKTSKDWVEAHSRKRKNYRGVSRMLFSLVFCTGIILMVVAVVFASIKSNRVEGFRSANNQAEQTS